MGKVLERQSLSNQGQSSQTESVNRVTIASHFEGIIAGRDVSCAKTETGISQFQSLGVSPQQQSPHEPKLRATDLENRM